MTAWIRKYNVLLRMEWAVMIAYRSESIIWMLGAFIQPLVSLAVWLSIHDSGYVTGFTAREYILYFIGVLVVERLTRSWDVWELDRDIREGTMSAKMLRPFHPAHWSLASNLVYKLFFTAILIPAWAILAMIFPALRLPIDLYGMLLVLLSLVLSSMIRFLIGYEFGMIAFWSNKATSIYMLYEGIHLFMAGRIAPLSLFPEVIADLARWLPFYPTVGFPVELMMGKFNDRPDLIGFNLLLQAGWALVFLIVFRYMWRSGVRKYGAVGG
jgi:ABC-2 type transport system permease protein